MRLFQKVKDGGKDSPVDAYVLIEIKSLFSITLLKFNKGTRDNFHSHAFNAWTWFLFGDMCEHRLVSLGSDNIVGSKYKRSLLPKVTKRNNLHKVIAKKTSWCFTIRGKWVDEWTEVTQEWDEITLTHNRKIVRVSKRNS